MSARYVAYYRASTEAQKRSGLGLEAQKAAFRAYVVEWPGEVVDEFTEIESGRKSARPQLIEALRICRVYGAKLVIARLDRLARNTALVARLLESEVDFVAADLPIANRLTLHILAAVAEYEAKLIAERVRGALAVLKARGKKLGSPSHSLAQTEALLKHQHLSHAARREKLKRFALAIAPDLIKLRDEGLSLNAIGTRLNSLGIETAEREGNWRRETVRSMFLLAGETLPDTWPTAPKRKRSAQKAR